jgi:hypothetical protein
MGKGSRIGELLLSLQEAPQRNIGMPGASRGPIFGAPTPTPRTVDAPVKTPTPQIGTAAVYKPGVPSGPGLSILRNKKMPGVF